jgi:hypothetical protein
MEVSGQLRFAPAEQAHGTHWMGGWVKLTAGLDAMAKRNLCSSRSSEPVNQPVTSECTKPSWLIAQFAVRKTGRSKLFSQVLYLLNYKSERKV